MKKSLQVFTAIGLLVSSAAAPAYAETDQEKIIRLQREVEIQRLEREKQRLEQEQRDADRRMIEKNQTND